MPRLRHMLGFCTVLAAAVAASAPPAAPAQMPEPFADASYRDSQVVVSEAVAEPFVDASYREAQIVPAEPVATEPFVDASYREANVVPAEAEPFADVSYRDANIALPEPVPPLAVDASYREASRVVVPTATGGDGFDWADGLVGAGIVLGILLVIGAGVAVWWMTTHHGPRHPRGPAVPTH